MCAIPTCEFILARCLTSCQTKILQNYTLKLCMWTCSDFYHVIYRADMCIWQACISGTSW
jgi:hypothetical protein